MKSSLVPIACGTALALMAGAAAAHWSSVRDMTALAAMLPSASPLADPTPAPLPDDSLTREAKGFLAATRRDVSTPPASGNGAKPSSDSSTDVRIAKLLQLLEGTIEQNQELRENIADTNRSLSELRFQVDSYDGQFRPLKVEEEPSYYDDGSSGVLPPIDPF